MLEGKSVANPPRSLLYYEIGKIFKKLPDEIDRQENKIMQELLIVHNTISEFEAKESRKAKRQQAKQKLGGGAR
ncbi:hypothetical protein [Bacillus cereus group sp. IBL03679]|uniref:hypothetical protein n=1 Tax=Bacillus cereus group sp. IBL03679 TaxID=3240095 RepID=UPI003D2F6B96